MCGPCLPAATMVRELYRLLKTMFCNTFIWMCAQPCYNHWGAQLGRLTAKSEWQALPNMKQTWWAAHDLLFTWWDGTCGRHPPWGLHGSAACSAATLCRVHGTAGVMGRLSFEST